MTKHYGILRSYLMEVTRDMIERGQIQRKQGQRIEDVIRTQGNAVAAEIMDDVKRAASEMGMSAVATAVGLMESFVTQSTSAAASAVGGEVKSAFFEALAGAMRPGPRR